MKRLVGFMALALALMGGHWINLSQAGDRTPIILGTATPGGGGAGGEGLEVALEVVLDHGGLGTDRRQS